MGPLIDSEDMERFGYEPVSDGVLKRASARVRRFVNQGITPGESAVTLPGSGPWLLPERPVVEVESVRDRAGDDVSYRVEGQYLVSGACGPLVVSYSHGFDPLPEGLVELVCSIASRIDSMPDAVGAGVRTEQAGAEMITWGAEAYNAASGLTRAEEKALRSFYPKLPGTVRLL